MVFALAMAIVEPPACIPGDASLRVRHIGAFVILSALAAWAYPRTSFLAIFILLTLFRGMIELIQMIPTLNRSPEWIDWLIDSAVVALTLFIVSALRDVRGKIDD